MKRKLLQINLMLGLILIVLLNVSAQTGVSSKEKKVNEITALTVGIFPVAEFQKFNDKSKVELPQTFKNEFGKNVAEQINAQKDLTAAQKKEAIDKAPILLEKIVAYIEEQAAKKFGPIEPMVTAYYKESFSAYSDEEILKLSEFFNSPAGKNYLLITKQFSSSQFAEQGKKVELDKQYDAEITAFIKTPLGAKYINSFSEGVISTGKKIDSAPTDFVQELIKDGQVKKMIDDFIKTELHP